MGILGDDDVFELGPSVVASELVPELVPVVISAHSTRYQFVQVVDVEFARRGR